MSCGGLKTVWSLAEMGSAPSEMLRTVIGCLDMRGLGVDRFVDRRLS